MNYLIGAIRTVYPSASEKTVDLLSATQTPPVRLVTTSLVNELDDLDGLILALDDYQTITEPTIHELLSALIEHLPQRIHLALASRSDPPAPASRKKAEDAPACGRG